MPNPIPGFREKILICKIADRFIGANHADLTTLEKQIFNLLQEAGYLELDGNLDIVSVDQ